MPEEPSEVPPEVPKDNPEISQIEKLYPEDDAPKYTRYIYIICAELIRNGWQGSWDDFKWGIHRIGDGAYDVLLDVVGDVLNGLFIRHGGHHSKYRNVDREESAKSKIRDVDNSQSIVDAMKDIVGEGFSDDIFARSVDFFKQHPESYEKLIQMGCPDYLAKHLTGMPPLDE